MTTSMKPILALLLLAMVLAPIHAQWPTTDPSKCCGLCLESWNAKGVDALNYTQCSAAQTTCCFGESCQPESFGSPIIDGKMIQIVKGRPTVPSGVSFSMKWKKATRVHYFILADGEDKFQQVKNGSDVAEKQNDLFLLCSDKPGLLYYRAFSSNACQASTEKYIQVVQGNGSKCSSVVISPQEVLLPKDLQPSMENATECDPVRGSRRNDGVCVCVGDYSNPPRCDGWPWWKYIYVIGGVLAALFSICISVRTYLNWKKKHTQSGLFLNIEPKASFVYSRRLNTTTILPKTPRTKDIPDILEPDEAESSSYSYYYQPQDAEQASVSLSLPVAAPPPKTKTEFML